jgi:SAM-dependent methyltransferase
MKWLQRYKKWVFSVVALSGFVLLGLPLLELLRPSPPGQSADAQLSSERQRFLPPDRVVTIMNLRPDLTVLDIGAGLGLFTFRFADAVGAGGRVYATDVDPRAIRSLRREVHRRDLANVIPRRVRAQGLDPFYSKHRFDVVFACDVLPLMSAPEAFFNGLRGSMTPDARLWIITMRVDADFNAAEFDALAVPGWGAADSAVAPLFERLRPEVKGALMAAGGASMSPVLKQMLVDDLNRLLEDATLWPAVERRAPEAASAGSAAEARVWQFLLDGLHEEGVFAAAVGSLSGTARPRLRLLNRFVVQKLLGTDVWMRAFSLDGLHWEQWAPLLHWQEQTPALLRGAGFELVAEHRTLPYHYIWEFKRFL